MFEPRVQPVDPEVFPVIEDVERLADEEAEHWMERIIEAQEGDDDL